MLKFGLCVGLVLSLGSAEPAQAQTITKLVQGSAFKGVHGIKFAPSGELYAGSVVGQTLYGVNVDTGAIRVIEKPPEGMADDMAFGPGGQVVWTSISASLVRSRIGNGPVTVLTSARTASACQGFAFALQAHRRATIVGETAPGLFSARRQVTEHFWLLLPEARPWDEPYRKPPSDPPAKPGYTVGSSINSHGPAVPESPANPPRR